MSQPADMIEQKKADSVAASTSANAVKRDAQYSPDKSSPDENVGPKWLPQGMKDTWKQLSEKWSQARTSSIEATPTFIVNNSSNVLGAAHVATEMLMFKSGMKDAKLINNPSNPINWVWEPVKNIAADVFTKSKSRDYSPMQLLRGNPIKNFQKYVMDGHGASIREADRQIASNRELVSAGKTPKKLSLGNPWQSRTTLAGLVIWSLSVMIPEKKESDEEIERMAKMRTLHPVKYIGERLKQAVWFPEWNTHKREMLGLGYLTIGTLSMLGSWRQRRNFKKSGMRVNDGELVAKGLKDAYTFNGAYFITSVISFIAGLPLLFALDERKAYSTYGSLSLLRIPFLYPSIHSKVKAGEDGWQSYAAGKLLFQVEDFMFSLIGGATKKVKPDGSIEIVDHEKLKKRAIKEAKAEKARDKEGERHTSANASPESHTPHTTISHVSAERAMPERVGAVDRAKEAAVV